MEYDDCRGGIPGTFTGGFLGPLFFGERDQDGPVPGGKKAGVSRLFCVRGS